MIGGNLGIQFDLFEDQFPCQRLPTGWIFGSFGQIVGRRIGGIVPAFGFGFPGMVEDAASPDVLDFPDIFFKIEPSHLYSSFGTKAGNFAGQDWGWNLNVRIPGSAEIRAYPQNFGNS